MVSETGNYMRPGDEFVEGEMRSVPVAFWGFGLTSESVVVVVAAGPNLRM